jgi:hypothetical protein
LFEAIGQWEWKCCFSFWIEKVGINMNGKGSIHFMTLMIGERGG